MISYASPTGEVGDNDLSGSDTELESHIKTMQGTSSVLSLEGGEIVIVGKQPIVIGDSEFWGNACIVLKLSAVLLDSDLQLYTERGFDYRLSVELGEINGVSLVSQSTDRALKNALEIGFDLLS